MNSVYIDSAVAASPIYIGPTNANSIIIGNANCSTVVNGPLVMGTGKNITLQPTTGYVAQTSGQLGYVISGATPPASTSVVSATPNIVSSISLTETGVYMFSAILQIMTNSVTVSNITWISLTVVIGSGIPLLLDERLNQLPPSTSYGFGLQLCGIVSNIGSNTYNLKLNTNFTGGAPAYTNYAFSFKAVRIG